MVFGIEGSALVEELKGLALNGEAKRIVERLRQEASMWQGEMLKKDY